MPEVPQDDGLSIPQGFSASPTSSSPSLLSIPKNRSTGSLLAYEKQAQSQARIRFSADLGKAGEHETMLKSPILADHEHGLGASGLRRIRQGPPSRGSTLPPSPDQSFSFPSRSASMTALSSSSSRKTSLTAVPVPPSPGIPFSEDLTRFPSESLHSFSFTAQSEEYLQNRQTVIARSIDFWRDQPGWAAKSPGLINAQAKVSGDTEMQSMVELLNRTKYEGYGGIGPMTGPALLDSENPFEQNFAARSESPEPEDEQTAGSRNLAPSLHIIRHTPQGSKAGILPPATPPVPSGQRGNSHGTGAVQPTPQRRGLRRTYTDIAPLTLQTKLEEALAQPYKQSIGLENTLLSPTTLPGLGRTMSVALTATHGQKGSPAAQAIFTTESKAPWTILAANDLACLVFGVTRAEIKKLSMLEIVQEDRRQWLEDRLSSTGSEAAAKARAASNLAKQQKSSPTNPISNLNIRGGITALLLSKPPSRQTASKKAQADGDSNKPRNSAPASGTNHIAKGSRGVLLCGDIIPIQKRNGATGSASLWVKEKKNGLIWVVEEIVQDTAFLTVDQSGKVLSHSGVADAIWGERASLERKDLRKLVPRLPMTTSIPKQIDLNSVNKIRHFTATNVEGYNVPILMDAKASLGELRVSSLPHIAGILVLNSKSLEITSSNAVFSAALFGHNNVDGRHITDLIPHFAKLVDILAEDEDVELIDGVVVPEQSFRRARALLALREGNADAAAIFEHPSSIIAKHRDGSQLHVDVQLRVVNSDSSVPENAVIEEREEDDRSETGFGQSEVVFALWLTYSRHLHSVVRPSPSSPLLSRPGTPPHQPSPGQSIALVEESSEADRSQLSPTSFLTQQIKEAANEPLSSKPSQPPVMEIQQERPSAPDPLKKRTIDDYQILEDMGQGAYGQVKLARHKEPPHNKVVLKYVTKKRILVDTWTRDRRLGTVPLEIHVLDYLRRDGFKHPNIVEMIGFFEDNINYYIEMIPHGLPGMDLFDYIEMRPSMDEDECRKIFLQVVDAIYHLHVHAKVVHRDIKDENIILDQDNHVKLIDFGSAAYTKSGPFDVFVGTIDYAAPEVLQGSEYGGKEQDIWALGILLYTLVYKENPFYNVDEILDRDLRIPWILSEGSIDLIKLMLNRNIDERPSIEQVWNHEWCAAGRKTSDDEDTVGVSS